jgi:putative flippase GtrA
MTPHSSDPSEFDPTQAGSGAARVASQARFASVLAPVGAIAAALLGQPAFSGMLLLASALQVKRPGWRVALTRDSANGRLGPLFDFGIVAALVAWQALAQSKSTIHGPGPWSLAGVSLVVAGARAIAPSKGASGTAIARALLAIALLLTPVAELITHIAPSAWAITACTAWAAVHLLTQARRALMHLDSNGVVRSYRLILSGKGGATRNATAAITATGIDFALFSTLVTLGALPPVATLLGAVSGGIVNFTVNRSWTFDASGSKRTMARRYVLVSGASAALNASLVAALLWVPEQHVTVSWLVARGLIFLGWNYPLHRDYVFAHGGRSVSQH